MTRKKNEAKWFQPKERSTIGETNELNNKKQTATPNQNITAHASEGIDKISNTKQVLKTLNNNSSGNACNAVLTIFPQFRKALLKK